MYTPTVHCTVYTANTRAAVAENEERFRQQDISLGRTFTLYLHCRKTYLASANAYFLPVLSQQPASRKQKTILLLQKFLLEATPTMLASSAAVARRRIPASVRTQAVRAQSTQVGNTDGPIAEDGRHEVWREGIYDHDNEPK